MSEIQIRDLLKEVQVVNKETIQSCFARGFEEFLSSEILESKIIKATHRVALERDGKQDSKFFRFLIPSLTVIIVFGGFALNQILNQTNSIQKTQLEISNEITKNKEAISYLKEQASKAE